MNIKNERGYTLISVLAIIILIMSFAMLLIPKTLNTSAQVNKSEGNSQAKDLSEMGIQYAHAYLQNIVTGAITDTKNNPISNKYPTITNQDTLFCLNLRERLNNAHIKNTPMSIDSPYSFRVDYLGAYTLSFIDNLSYTIKSTETTRCTGFKGVKVPIQSVGKVDGKTQKTINAEFVIENKGEDGNRWAPGTEYYEPVDPSALIYSNVETQEVKLSGKVESSVQGTKFNQQVVISGNGNLKIGGHAWFRGTYPSVTLNGGQKVVLAISGDAYFNSKAIAAEKNYICIKGYPYLLEKVGTTERWVDYEDLANDNKCPPEIRREVEYSNDINEWGIIEGELNISY